MLGRSFNPFGSLIIVVVFHCGSRLGVARVGYLLKSLGFIVVAADAATRIYWRARVGEKRASQKEQSRIALAANQVH
jgi:hypothetical protein